DQAVDQQLDLRNLASLRRRMDVVECEQLEHQRTFVAVASHRVQDAQRIGIEQAGGNQHPAAAGPVLSQMLCQRRVLFNLAEQLPGHEVRQLEIHDGGGAHLFSLLKLRSWRAWRQSARAYSPGWPALRPCVRRAAASS